MNEINRPELADFLRHARARLQPAEAGLPEGPRRRTPGLRREEVAQLTGMSPDYYMRLEQARGPQPSPQILAALAGALRLSEDERDHLYLLAGHQPPAARPAGTTLAPGVKYLLDQLSETPVQVVSDLGDLLAQNIRADEAFGGVCSVQDDQRNIVWSWFTNPRVRETYGEEERLACGRHLVADLRAAVARRGADPEAHALVERLRAHSPQFAEIWAQHEVSVQRSRVVRLPHPETGSVEYHVETLLTPAADQRLLLFTAT
jgi:transcriptional regulator with XRE-family HTH domain